jgi:choline kinase
MKALILAAGRGTRIRSVHGDRPKCLIRCDGAFATILDYQIESLFDAGVKNIGIVVGYEKEQIVRHIFRRYVNRLEKFHFIENPLFSTTNNIYSFSLAETWLNRDPFVCLNADVIFDPEILTPALQSCAPVTMIVDPDWRDETMKVIISAGKIVRMSKRIPQSAFSGTYIGITSFGSVAQETLFDKVRRLIRSGHENEFFNVAVQELADEGVPIGFTSTGSLPWAEIDDPGDLAFARQHVFPRLASLPLVA